jgi:hypothetical protein
VLLKRRNVGEVGGTTLPETDIVVVLDEVEGVLGPDVVQDVGAVRCLMTVRAPLTDHLTEWLQMGLQDVTIKSPGRLE